MEKLFSETWTIFWLKNFRELKIFAVTFKKQTRAQANKGDAPWTFWWNLSIDPLVCSGRLTIWWPIIIKIEKCNQVQLKIENAVDGLLAQYNLRELIAEKDPGTTESRINAKNHVCTCVFFPQCLKLFWWHTASVRIFLIALGFQKAILTKGAEQSHSELRSSPSPPSPRLSPTLLARLWPTIARTSSLTSSPKKTIASVEIRPCHNPIKKYVLLRSESFL